MKTLFLLCLAFVYFSGEGEQIRKLRNRLR